MHIRVDGQLGGAVHRRLTLTEEEEISWRADTLLIDGQPFFTFVAANVDEARRLIARAVAWLPFVVGKDGAETARQKVAIELAATLTAMTPALPR